MKWNNSVGVHCHVIPAIFVAMYLVLFSFCFLFFEILIMRNAYVHIVTMTSHLECLTGQTSLAPAFIVNDQTTMSSQPHTCFT